MIHQLSLRTALQPGSRAPFPPRGLIQQQAGQGQKVPAAFPQRRHAQFQRTQTLRDIRGQDALGIHAAHPGEAASGFAIHGPGKGSSGGRGEVLQPGKEEAATRQQLEHPGIGPVRPQGRGGQAQVGCSRMSKDVKAPGAAFPS